MPISFFDEFRTGSLLILFLIINDFASGIVVSSEIQIGFFVIIVSIIIIFFLIYNFYPPRYALFTIGSEIKSCAFPLFTISPVSSIYPLFAIDKALYAFCSTRRTVVPAALIF